MGRIFMCGDLHGSAIDFKQRVNNYIPEPQEDDIIICCGDVGLEYGGQIQGALKKAMSKFPGTIWVMRGNHDNRYWKCHTKTMKGYVEKPNKNWHFDNDISPTLLIQDKYPNIWYVRDEGGIYNINGYNFLFIPGAYSVDRYYRLNTGRPYEPAEQLTWSEENQLLASLEYSLSIGKHIDYVVSHTAPLGTQIYFRDLFLSFIDQSAVDSHMEYFLDEIYKILNNDFKCWYFGHYHDTRSFGKFTMLYHQIQEIGD